MAKKRSVAQVRKSLESQIDWENWREDESPHKFYKVSGVLYSRLEWLREQINSGGEIDAEEAKDTISMCQEALELLPF